MTVLDVSVWMMMVVMTMVMPLAMFSINLSITGSPSKGVRIMDGETDLEDFDLGLESELEDVKN